MKFAAQEVLELEAFGIKIEEYCMGKDNPFPIDCAIVYFRNNVYPCKINYGFYEAFFVLEGECEIVFENETVQLSKHDFHVIAPGKKHITKAKYADILVCCTPPFDRKKLEYCNMN